MGDIQGFLVSLVHTLANGFKYSLVEHKNNFKRF
uniref:Uncharacterized protein n=1 Tax=Rhizophora mucronata TaxID=61149 RepID=A0A2P2P231_RHIMU